MMKVNHIKDIRALCAQKRQEGLSVGLVPTMGYLHAGHAALIRKAVCTCDFVVVSVFVNPVQFGPGEDFEAYPRNQARDEALCAEEGVGAVFAPSAEEMYGKNHSVFVDEDTLSRGLCGAHRPGHFRGVLTVVAKLFNIVGPDRAFFGRKDIQQLRLIEKMVEDLNFGIRIVPVSIVREEDGLALSSRNAYLAAEERAQAPVVHESLELAQQMLSEGERRVGRIKPEMERMIRAREGTRLEYIEFVDYETLEQVEIIAGKTIIACAVVIGGTRLIDNVIVELDASQ
jgi:pantoate--beta-alanine ligase